MEINTQCPIMVSFHNRRIYNEETVSLIIDDHVVLHLTFGNAFIIFEMLLPSMMLYYQEVLTHLCRPVRSTFAV